jgi:hypothetical protein
MKIIAFILEREEVIRILTQHSWIRTFEKKSFRQEMYMIFSKVLKHLEMWPIEYPKPCPVEARASPLDFKPLRKLSDYSNLQ